MNGCLKWTLMGIGGLVVVVFGLAVLVAVTGTDSPAATPTPQAPAVSLAVLAPTATPVPAATPTPAASPTATVPPTATPEPLTLTGTGQQASPALNLADGLAVFEFSHQGAGYFGVTLLDAQGEPAALIANDVGAVGGSKAAHVGAGEYLLDVTADGPWTVRVTQPAPAGDAPGLPVRFEGTGPTASPFFVAPGGLLRFEFSHQGDGYFGVTLLNAQGRPVDLVANELGVLTGSKATGAEPGAYLLDVAADGPWWVSISQ